MQKISTFLHVIGGSIVFCMLGITALSLEKETSARKQNPEPMAVTTTLPSQEKNSCPYIVQKGDTLIGIAFRLTKKSENYKQIMQFNGLTSEVIHVNDRLCVPKHLLLKEYQCEPAPVPVPTVTSPPAPTPTPTLTLTPRLSPTPTASPRPTLTPHPKKSERRILAEIEGLVFEDLNGNGYRDPGEPGMPGLTVILVKDVIKQTSDAQGKFSFREIDPGEQSVALDERSVPAGCYLTTASSVLRSLTEGDRGYVTFGVTCD